MVGRGFAIYYRDRRWKLKADRRIIRWDPVRQKKVVEFVPRTAPYKRADFYFFSVRKVRSQPGQQGYHFRFRYYRSWGCRKLLALYYRKRVPADLELHYKMRWVGLTRL